MIMTDDELQQLRERNAARAKAAIAKMGKTYLLHPKNRVTKDHQPRVLDQDPVSTRAPTATASLLQRVK
jgi:hypothetical protein